MLKSLWAEGKTAYICRSESSVVPVFLTNIMCFQGDETAIEPKWSGGGGKETMKDVS